MKRPEGCWGQIEYGQKMDDYADHLERERDELKRQLVATSDKHEATIGTMLMVYKKECDRYERQLAAMRESVKGLRPYMTHTVMCDDHPSDKCKCGFDAALEAARKLGIVEGKR